VLAAVHALGADQRGHSLRLDRLRTEVADGFRVVDGQFRSVGEQLAEIKGLISAVGTARPSPKP